MDKIFRSGLGKPPISDIQFHFNPLHLQFLLAAFISTESSVTGATEPTRRFMGFWHLASTNGSAYRVAAGGVWGDCRAPRPITESVGGVPGLGGCV